MISNNRRELTARDIAILRYLWKLEPQETALLDSYFVGFMPVTELRKALQFEPTRDVLKYQNIRYEVVELGFKLADESVDDRTVIISFRVQRSGHVAIALVKLHNPKFEMTTMKPVDLKQIEYYSQEGK